MKKDLYFENPLLKAFVQRAKLVIFDMNGLIVDDEAIQLESVNRIFENFNIKLDKSYWITNCVGKRADEYLTSIFKKHNISVDVKFLTGLIANKNQWYQTLVSQNISRLVRPGVLDIINFFSKSPVYLLSLATSALEPELETILGYDGLNIKHHFRHIITGAEVRRSKPDPEIYQLLSARAGIQPSRCLVFEDSGHGVTASHRAGIPCIAVPNRFTAHQDFSNARCVVDNLTRSANIISQNRSSKLV